MTTVLDTLFRLENFTASALTIDCIHLQSPTMLNIYMRDRPNPIAVRLHQDDDLATVTARYVEALTNTDRHHQQIYGSETEIDFMESKPQPDTQVEEGQSKQMKFEELNELLEDEPEAS
jgi:hypothetical protein